MIKKNRKKTFKEGKKILKGGKRTLKRQDHNLTKKSKRKSKKKTKLLHINKKRRTRKKILENFKGGTIIMYSVYAEDDNTHTKQKRRCMCVNYETDMSNNMNITNNRKGRRCNKTALSNSDFCEDHQNCLGFLGKFLSGYEKEYNPKEWSHPYIEGSHNCYSYFLDDKTNELSNQCEKLCLDKNGNNCPKKTKGCRDLIPQPGNHFLLKTKGNLKSKTRHYTCDEMNNKILQDNKSIKNSKLLEKCPKNYYKGAMVTDPGNTFHFYRQNKDGTWSHKPGTLPVIDTDSDGKVIYVPHFANRDYSSEKRKKPINYTNFCHYYCIPSNKYETTYAI